MAADPEKTDGGPKLPPLPVDRIAATRDRLVDLLGRHVGRVPEGDDFLELCWGLARAVETGPSDPAIAETVRALPRQPLTAGGLRIFCWRVAANLAALRKGRPVRPWSCQPRAEWMAFEVLSGATHRFQSGRRGFRYRCRVVAGSACPEVVPVTWSDPQVARAARELGFTRRGKKRRPYGHPLQLVRLRFAANVLPARSEEHPGFDLDSLRVPGPMKAWNVQILNARIRREPPCPMGFSHPCARCPAGYSLGPLVCPAAVRPVAWVWQYCETCRSESFWDPTLRASCCLECVARAAR